MERNYGSKNDGSNFDALMIEIVWQKGSEVSGNDSSLIRLDSFGSPILRKEYGKTTDFGWEIDHIYPSSKGGSDSISNLQPLQWKNNRTKGDNV